MKRKRFSAEQIIGILNEAAAGAAAVEVCRRHGISETTFYRWKAKFGGLAVSDAKRLRQLEAENSRLKRLLAEAASGQRGAQGPAHKKLVTPAARRRALEHLCAAHRCSERRACGLVGLARSVARYQPRRRDDAELRARLRELAGRHRRFGYLRLHELLRWEGLVINRKRTYRLYKAENLTVRRGRRHRPPERERLRLVVPERRNQRWSMDFASDALWTGRRIRCLCIVDDATRESPALLPDFSIGGAGRASARRARVPPRPAGGDRHGQRAGSHRPGALRLVGTYRGAAALHPTRQADPERARRELHRPVSGRGPEPALVRLARRGRADHRGLAAALQP